MSDEAKQLTFTLADHDLLVRCVAGIDTIITKMAEITLRQDGADKRMKALEDWKIKVMAIVLCIGILFGYTLRVFDFLAHVISPPSAPVVVQPVPAPTPVPSTEQKKR